MRSHIAVISALLAMVMSVTLVSGCKKAEAPESQKELLIYCGITMIKPMAEIAQIIEQQEGCKITITKGGSGNLLNAIKVNKVGDLFLPGSDSYIKTCQEENLVTDTAYVGTNRAAMMVQKGNPKGITADLDNLVRKDLYVVICNYKTGSIGKETKKILDAKGIFDAVQENATELTTDSKRLFLLLKEKQADLVINWFAVSTWDDNPDYVDVLEIDEQYASRKKLVLGLLTTSQYPDLAKKFMDYASSEDGRAIFEKYGLGI